MSETTHEYTSTNVVYLYLIIGFILAIPAIGFVALHIKSGATQARSDPRSESPRSMWNRTSTRALVALFLVGLMNLLVIGSQDIYGDMLLTFAVLGPLNMTKTSGMYLTTAYWAAMSFGNLNGERTSGYREN